MDTAMKHKVLSIEKISSGGWIQSFGRGVYILNGDKVEGRSFSNRRN